MNLNHAEALVNIKNEVCVLQALFAKSLLSPEDVKTIYEKTVALRSNATVLKEHATALLSRTA